MASVTHAATVWTTSAGSKSATATPAVGDLIVVFAGRTGVNATPTTTAVTDDNADGLGTYTQIGGDQTNGLNNGSLSMWIRDALIGSATSTVFSAAQTNASGGGLCVLRVSGMLFGGSAAIRSSGGESSGGAGATPAPVLSLTPLSANPILTAVQNGSNPAAITPRSSPAYSEAFDNGYNTPTQGLEVSFLNSGESSATITYGGTSATAFASWALELNADVFVPRYPGVNFQGPGVL